MNKGFSLSKYTVKALPRSLITILIIMANRENKISKEQRTDCEYRIMLTSNDCLNKEIEKKALFRAKRACITQASQGQRDFLLALGYKSIEFDWCPP